MEALMLIILSLLYSGLTSEVGPSALSVRSFEGGRTLGVALGGLLLPRKRPTGLCSNFRSAFVRHSLSAGMLLNRHAGMSLAESYSFSPLFVSWVDTLPHLGMSGHPNGIVWLLTCWADRPLTKGQGAPFVGVERHRLPDGVVLDMASNVSHGKVKGTIVGMIPVDVVNMSLPCASSPLDNKFVAEETGNRKIPEPRLVHRSVCALQTSHLRRVA